MRLDADMLIFTFEMNCSFQELPRFQVSVETSHMTLLIQKVFLIGHVKSWRIKWRFCIDGLKSFRYVVFAQNIPPHLSLSASALCLKSWLQKLPVCHTCFICNYSAEARQQITLSNGLKLCKEHWTPPFLHNYPSKSALMSSLSFCPEASPHSVCKVPVPITASVWLTESVKAD